MLFKKKKKQWNVKVVLPKFATKAENSEWTTGRVNKDAILKHQKSDVENVIRALEVVLQLQIGQQISNRVPKL